jgi:alpha-tubulin suppressor-like RCC1 family protein
MNLSLTGLKPALLALLVCCFACSAFGQFVRWGGNSHGQLGLAQNPRHASPVQVDQTGVLAGKVIIAIAPGGRHTLALDSAGAVYAWGGNRYGQLGTGTYASSATPVAVSGGSLVGKTVVDIRAGGDISVALDSDGVVHTWGAGASGALGRGSSSDSLLPEVLNHGVLVGKTVSQIACGDAFVLALATDNTLAAWGTNGSGQLPCAIFPLRSM